MEISNGLRMMVNKEQEKWNTKNTLPGKINRLSGDIILSLEPKICE